MVFVKCSAAPQHTNNNNKWNQVKRQLPLLWYQHFYTKIRLTIEQCYKVGCRAESESHITTVMARQIITWPSILTWLLEVSLGVTIGEMSTNICLVWRLRNDNITCRLPASSTTLARLNICVFYENFERLLWNYALSKHTIVKKNILWIGSMKYDLLLFFR